MPAVCVQVSIECSDAEQRIAVQMQGTAATPMVTVTPSVLRFGDCPVNDRRDILISVQNKTKFPTSFEFPIIANFKFEPTKGHLHALETVSVVASFLPPQLGKFKSAIKLSLANGLGTFEVHAIGNSADPGDRKKLIGGTDLLPNDFIKQRKFVNPEEEATARSEQKKAEELLQHQAKNALRTALKERIGSTSYVALPKSAAVLAKEAAEAAELAAIHADPNVVAAAGGVTGTALGATAPAAMITNPGTVGGNQGIGTGVDAQGSLASQSIDGVALPGDSQSHTSSMERDYMYGFTDKSVAKPLPPHHPMLVRREHNQQYNDFLQKSHALRQQSSQKTRLLKSLKKGAIDFADPNGVNMGMERGLDEPQLKVPVAGEPLWLANRGTGGEGSGALRLPADENRLIMKKYNSTPATQAELRDCTVELTQDQLKLVTASHKVIAAEKGALYHNAERSAMLLSVLPAPISCTPVWY